MKALVIAALLSSVSAAALAASPFDGTWKTDMSSVKFPTKPDIEVLKDGMYTCQTCAPPYTIKADGTDQPVTGHPYYDTVAIKVVDDHTIQDTRKKHGKTVFTSTVTVTADGETETYQYSDSTSPNGALVTATGTEKKVAPGPVGSHATSGSWIGSSASASDNGITSTYATSGNTLMMTSPTGQSYTAPMNGKKVAYKGDPGQDMVSVERTGTHSFVETDYRNGKVIGKASATVSKDGKTMSVSYWDALHNSTVSGTMIKQ